jgi:NADPH2:quinone reductase
VSNKSEALLIRHFGAFDIMVLEPLLVNPVGSGDILIRQSVASVNFYDIYVRSGAYRTLSMPASLVLKS